jgi:tetratricopeptide (TPR) repeat protein
MKSITKLKDDARRLEQREEWGRAIEVYLQVLRLADAGDSDADLPLYNRVGDLCVRLGRIADSVTYYEEAADRYAESGLFNNAIALCNKALRHAPDRVDLLRKLGQYSASQGFLTDARRYFLDYAERRFSAGAVDDALNALDDFARVADDAEIWELLGRRLQANGRTDAAVEALRRAYAMRREASEDAPAEALRAEIQALAPDLSLDDAAAADASLARSARPAPAPRASDPLPGLVELESSDPAVESGMEAIAPDEATPLEGLETTDLSSDGFETAARPDEDDALAFDPLDLEDFEITSFAEAEPPASADAANEDEGSGDPGFDAVQGLESTALDFSIEPADVTRLDVDLPRIDDSADGLDLPLLDDEAESETVEAENAAPPQESSAADGGAGGLSLHDVPPLTDDSSEEDDDVTTAGFDLPLLDDTEAAAARADDFAEPRPWESGSSEFDTAEFETGDLDVDPSEFDTTSEFNVETGDFDPSEFETSEFDTSEFDVGEKDADAAAGPEAFDFEAAGDPPAPPAPPEPTAAAWEEAQSDEAPSWPGELADAVSHDAEPEELEPHPAEPEESKPYAAGAQALEPYAAESEEEEEEEEPQESGAMSSDAGASVRAGKDFVDLGALLAEDEEEKGTRFRIEETAPTGDEDRDFAELLSQFKAKVSEHVPTEDAASHYDLGLAFKEMGLIDEAIAEFQIALRSGSMRLKVWEELGACFLQKEQYNIAEKVARRALEAPYEDELELLGVYYILGRASEALGRQEQARDAYERVLGLDINFEDVSKRLLEL